MLESILFTTLIGGLILFFLYRRVRRLFGRQEFHHRRLIFRVVMFAAIVLLIIPVAILSGPLSMMGAVLGAGLGFLALRRTRFEVEESRVFYTPNTLMSSLVISLFLGRLAYRLITMGGRITEVRESGTGGLDLLGGPQPGSLTLLVLFVLLGYYLFYYTGVLVRGNRLEADKAETPRV